ncbi:hypothetical protein D3C80_1668030 [compost metagenome]
MLHDVEFALGAIESPAAQRFRHALKIPERLEKRDFQSVVANHSSDIGWTAVEGQEIIFEDFHPVEPGCSNGRQFLGKLSADRHRGNRCFHYFLLLKQSAFCTAKNRNAISHTNVEMHFV